MSEPNPNSSNNSNVSPPSGTAGTAPPAGSTDEFNININGLDSNNEPVSVSQDPAFLAMQKEFAELKAARETLERKQYIEEFEKLNKEQALKYKDAPIDELRIRLDTAKEIFKLQEDTKRKKAPGHNPNPPEEKPKVIGAGYLDNATGEWKSINHGYT